MGKRKEIVGLIAREQWLREQRGARSWVVSPGTATSATMCREPVRHSARDKGHEEGGSAYAKAGSSLRSPPGYSRAFPPPPPKKKTQSLPTLLLCALTSDFTGGCPLPPSHSLCQRVNLQLQFIKFLLILPFNFQLSLHLECGTHHAY